jgi:hypothetical protein
MLLVCSAPPKGRGAYVGHQNERPDGPDQGPDGPRSGQSAPVGQTVRVGAEQIRVSSFLLCLLARISG